MANVTDNLRLKPGNFMSVLDEYRLSRHPQLNVRAVLTTGYGH